MINQEDIVRYWHAVELLQPQAAPKVIARNSPHDAFFHNTPIKSPILPWVPESIVNKQMLPKKRIWSHTLYAHIYDSKCVADKLKRVFGADQGYQEPQHRESGLFAIKFSTDGHMVHDSLVLSSEAWFLGKVLADENWTRGFDEDQRAIGKHANALLTGQVTGEALRDLTQWILQFMGVGDFFGDMDRHAFRFRSQPVRPDKVEQEDDPLNSFLLADLADVADSIARGVKSPPLDHYLHRHDPAHRLHIDDDRNSLQLIDRLMPDAYSNSCWPTRHHLGLVHSQQLAVNTVMNTLANGEGLLGVNGPPGTGKTTLLRDLIAAIVASRADALATLPRASDAFMSDARETANDSGKPQTIYKLNPALYGFEIVVASSNNGAVENITLELPQRDTIDDSWLPDAEHFADVGELITGTPAWGLISGALGSKARRTTFVERYFFGVPPFGTEDKAEPAPDDPINTDDDDAPTEKAEDPKGFLEWLNTQAHVNRPRSTEDRQLIWQQAVADYDAAKALAQHAQADAAQIRELVQAICQTRQKVADLSVTQQTLEQKLKDTQRQLANLDVEESQSASTALQQCIGALRQHQDRQPGFWAKLFSLWGTQRTWNTTHALLKSQHDVAKFEFDRVARVTHQLQVTQKNLERQADAARQELQPLQDLEQRLQHDATALATTRQADHLLAWLQSGTVGRGDAIELAEPWRNKGWRQARARVFIQALKLHQTFFELEASRLRANLFLANRILTGTHFDGFSRDAIRSAWASLFMVVPVLSSTFASFARSFDTLGAGEIGWLLVDEAGQAAPQAAVGALWRARRAIMVGDPFQLRPIVTVSDAVLEHMRTRYRVDPHWLPNRQSAQTLADAATPWGRLAGPTDNKTWVGLPLVVHRRCDRPMHDLSNRIAYDGAMVYGTISPPPDKATRASLPTGWIHVSGPSQGNWVPAEGDALQELLAALHADGVEKTDISVITPFRAVQQNLKRMLGDKMVSGTIHTMQGKEAHVVILVLGGSTASPGARDWAVSEPNLLNVAATRAKQRFYVIGDKNDWKNRPLFCDVMDLLPRQRISATIPVVRTAVSY